MPQLYRQQVTELAQLSREIIDAFVASRTPTATQLYRFASLIDALQPTSAADPFAGILHTLSTAQTFMAFAIEETHGGAAQARRSVVSLLRGAILDLDALLKGQPAGDPTK